MIAFACGLVFALGLGLAGMTDPNKVRAFLDVSGHWDPSLAFVMVGAIGVHAIFVRVARRFEKPLTASRFVLPTHARVDGRLIVGASIFGLGWGVAGFCPGPALVVLAGLQAPSIVFVASMLAGMALVGFVNRRPRGAATGTILGESRPRS